jgi:hypothetical protein
MAKAINDAIDALVFQLKIKYGSNGGTGTMANPTVELRNLLSQNVNMLLQMKNILKAGK